MSSLIETKTEDRAFVHLSLGPNSAAVALENALHCGQPDASARELLRAVEAALKLEQSLSL